ncbi:MAG: M20/M25/M40 family metallo-hydrolase [Lachnospiraceae bacterium]|nr:M20/M25/M40 family metallo-hydrolase [Lachnospiraceae bacterium]
METDRKRLTKEFLALASIDSESFHERRMADYLLSSLRAMGLSPEEDESGALTGASAGNIFCRAAAAKYGDAQRRTAASVSQAQEASPVTQETGAAPVLFCAHMDTVAPGNGRHAVLCEDGTIRSDGTTVLGADDGAAIAEILEALRMTLAEGKPHREIELLFTTAEEAYTRGAACFDCSKLHAETAFIPDLEGPQGSYSETEPTLVQFSAHIKGRPSHAGFAPERGVSALSVAVRALARLPEGRVDPDTTFNTGILRSGTGTNIIPGTAHLEGEIRSLDNEAALELYEELESILQEEAQRAAFPGFVPKVVTEKNVRLTAYRVPEGDPALGSFERACTAAGVTACGVQNFGGSDGNCLRRQGIPAITFANGMHEVHTCSEYTTVGEMAKAAEILYQIMRQ